MSGRGAEGSADIGKLENRLREDQERIEHLQTAIKRLEQSVREACAQARRRPGLELPELDRHPDDAEQRVEVGAHVLFPAFGGHGLDFVRLERRGAVDEKRKSPELLMGVADKGRGLTRVGEIGLYKRRAHAALCDFVSARPRGLLG